MSKSMIQSKYTLIELTVVLSVLVILMTLLMSALGTVKVISYRTQCLNDLSTSTKMILLSGAATNNKVKLLDYERGGVLGKWGSWGTALYDNGLTNVEAEGLYCPLTEPPELTSLTSTTRLEQYTYAVNYARYYKNTEDHARYEWGTSNHNNGLNITLVESPSEFVILTDAKKSGEPLNKSRFWRIPSLVGYSWAGRPWSLHSDDEEVTSAFMDGHARLTHIMDLREYVHDSLITVHDPYEAW